MHSRDACGHESISVSDPNTQTNDLYLFGLCMFCCDYCKRFAKSAASGAGAYRLLGFSSSQSKRGGVYAVWGWDGERSRERIVVIDIYRRKGRGRGRGGESEGERERERERVRESGEGKGGKNDTSMPAALCVKTVAQ